MRLKLSMVVFQPLGLVIAAKHYHLARMKFTSLARFQHCSRPLYALSLARREKIFQVQLARQWVQRWLISLLRKTSPDAWENSLVRIQNNGSRQTNFKMVVPCHNSSRCRVATCCC